MEVRVVEKLAMNQQATAAAARGSLSLMERGLARYPASWDQPAIYAVEGDRVVGVLCLTFDEIDRSATVSLAWCDDAAPRALTAMLLRLRKLARERTVSEIYFTAHAANDDMRKAARAFGLLPWSTTYRLSVSAPGPASC